MNAARTRIEASIQSYLSLFAPDRCDVTLRDVAIALDGLVATYFQTPEVEPTTDQPTAAPAIDEREFAINAARFFETDDVIWLIDPEGGPGQEAMCTFVTSELAEIANDLSQVLWEFEHGTEADAIWEFRFGYQTHWGDHLHRVRAYLHRQCAW